MRYWQVLVEAVRDTPRVRRKPSRNVSVRRRVLVGYVVAISFLALALSAGVGPPLSTDTWAYILLALPALSVTLGALVVTTDRTPASVLMAPRGAKGNARLLWRWFVVPYRVPLCTPIFLVASAYIGAGVSLLQSPARGLGPILFAKTGELGWNLPLAGLVFGVLLGWVGIMAVAVPLKVAAHVPRLWESEPREARRLLAYLGVVLGLELTVCAHVVAFWRLSDETSGRLSALRDELHLLLGGMPTDAPAWTRVMAWAGVISLFAAGAFAWRTAARAEK